jgi:hypothetical protein
MQIIKNVMIGIAIGISLPYILGDDIIKPYLSFVFLALASFAAFFSEESKSKQ